MEPEEKANVVIAVWEEKIRRDKKRRHETRDRRRDMRGKILGGGKRERQKRMGAWGERRQREKRE